MKKIRTIISLIILAIILSLIIVILYKLINKPKNLIQKPDIQKNKSIIERKYPEFISCVQKIEFFLNSKYDYIKNINFNFQNTELQNNSNNFVEELCLILQNLFTSFKLSLMNASNKEKQKETFDNNSNFFELIDILNKDRIIDSDFLKLKQILQNENKNLNIDTMKLDFFLNQDIKELIKEIEKQVQKLKNLNILTYYFLSKNNPNRNTLNGEKARDLYKYLKSFENDQTKLTFGDLTNLFQKIKEMEEFEQESPQSKETTKEPYLKKIFFKKKIVQTSKNELLEQREFKVLYNELKQIFDYEENNNNITVLTDNISQNEQLKIIQERIECFCNFCLNKENNNKNKQKEDNKILKTFQQIEELISTLLEKFKDSKFKFDSEQNPKIFLLNFKPSFQKFKNDIFQIEESFDSQNKNYLNLKEIIIDFRNLFEQLPQYFKSLNISIEDKDIK